MNKIPSVVSFALGVSLATASAFAQTAPQCAADFQRCNAQFPSRYRNQRTTAAASFTPCALGATTDEAVCDGTYQRLSVCGPPVVTNGPAANQVTVTCGGPANTRPRVHNRVIIVCREDMGLRDTERGCELQAGLPTNFNYAIVTLSSEQANGQLTERLRVAPHTIQVTYGAVRWPNGQPRPEDIAIARVLEGVMRGQAAQQGQINTLIQRADGQDAVISGIIGRQDRSDVRDDGQDAVIGQLRAARAFRLQFDGSLVGLVHWNAGQPVGAVGGGFVLRPAIVLRWTDSFGLRIYGGWGMGSQTNTPYHIPNPIRGEAPIEQSAPLHQGTFGIDGIIGEGSVAGIVGAGGFIAGRTAPAVVPGDLSGLVAWRASGRFGARFRAGGETNGFQFNLDAVLDLGVSNISASNGGQFSSPTTFGVGGEIALCITR